MLQTNIIKPTDLNVGKLYGVNYGDNGECFVGRLVKLDTNELTHTSKEYVVDDSAHIKTEKQTAIQNQTLVLQGVDKTLHIWGASYNPLTNMWHGQAFMDTDSERQFCWPGMGGLMLFTLSKAAHLI